MHELICVSAGQLRSKKKNSIFSEKHRYLNYGLLTLASILGKSGYNPIVIHGLFNSPANTLKTCERYGIQHTHYPVLVSIPSFFALEWSRIFIELLRSFCPEKRIVVGGRWVIGRNAEWMKSYLSADVVVPGLVGEEIIQIVRRQHSFRSFEVATSQGMTNSAVIDYRYLHERSLFQPSIQVSTGCGMGCSFCEEKDIRLGRLKAPENVAEEMVAVGNLTAPVEASPYLEASMFIATESWAQSLYEERCRRGVTCNWRAETRVDKMNATTIPALAKAGLKVIDLGLESASHLQLTRMNKTARPQAYLAKARELIETAFHYNIWVKINILFYGGETSNTMIETYDWLSSVKEGIKGVSAGPVIVFGLTQDSAQFIQELEDLGATAFPSDTVGVTNISPSKEFDFEASVKAATLICQEFMHADDYFDLKSFSYFSRNYTRSDFTEDLVGITQDDVPFKL